MINVLIADDHTIIRDGIQSMLARHEDIVVCGQVMNGNAAVEFVALHPTDIVLMDISMPSSNGIGATKTITERFPATKVIAISIHEQKELVKQMIDAGAMGYLLKDAEKKELLHAIKTVYEGKKYFSHAILNKLTPGSKQSSLLTEREKEILQLIAQEYTNQQIADRLFLSVRTVDTHRRNLHQKLDIKNTAGLVKYAIQIGLI
jgi:DNA-binding NarL/FixJ family response regulator